MKKVLKVLFTALFIIGSIIAINQLMVNYSNDGVVVMVLALAFFCLHLFAWIAPKVFFNLCWKITGILPDTFDYENSYGKLESVDIGMLLTSNILLGVVFLLI